VAADQGARFRLLVCQAPAAVLMQRVQLRQAQGHDASDATVEVLARQQGWVQWPSADEAAHTLWLDTDAMPDEVLQRVHALAF
jgi:predicted kinase